MSPEIFFDVKVAYELETPSVLIALTLKSYVPVAISSIFDVKIEAGTLCPIIQSELYESLYSVI